MDKRYDGTMLPFPLTNRQRRLVKRGISIFLTKEQESLLLEIEEEERIRKLEEANLTPEMRL